MEINSELNAQNNSDLITGNNQAINSNLASEINAENNAENSLQSNSENNPQNNSEINSGNTLGSGIGSSSGNNSGYGPGDNSGNNTGKNTWIVDPSTLPTINPIPSDNQVSQNVAKQNQQNEALASLLAYREALVIPARHQAESTKYQIISTDNLPSATITAPSSDIVEKVKSRQISLH